MNEWSGCLYVGFMQSLKTDLESSVFVTLVPIEWRTCEGVNCRCLLCFYCNIIGDVLEGAWFWNDMCLL